MKKNKIALLACTILFAAGAAFATPKLLPLCIQEQQYVLRDGAYYPVTINSDSECIRSQNTPCTYVRDATTGAFKPCRLGIYASID
ncbi:hypothetical protein LX64_00419 [Chitinophaga skermanii]|uniref:Uncharacterized protein n=1 Tax=Chitinophaga skermanii TaxID=331697 RepID=A0A327R4E3_9BACT|nr:DUF6520 family protein [Chitinophaga skermanii]RAJ10812.1 hypothetical protein LX64_00419 [Chitinophaga skermanii]